MEKGDAADLQILPALRQHDGDAGHYVTCGHVVTYDPDTRIDNMGIQRLCLRGARLMRCYMLETSHNMLNLRKFWARNEPCPIAIWVGHHPAIEMGAQSKLGYPESHWGVAGGRSRAARAGSWPGPRGTRSGRRAGAVDAGA